MSTIFDRWHVTPEYLTAVIDSNPSLRGILIGYIAEIKLRDLLSADKRLSGLRKDDDHDRAQKGDLVFQYRNHEFRVEVKCLDTNEVKIQQPDESWIPLVKKELVSGVLTKKGKPKYRYVRNPEFDAVDSAYRKKACYKGKFQCNGSDSREVELPNGTTLTTNCLVVGEFDILAVCLFTFHEQWQFAFARNDQLPRSQGRDYSEEVRQHLLSSSMRITWPLQEPFVDDIFPVLDELVRQKSKR